MPGDHELEIHVAARGPKMLAALADSVDGYTLQTPEHTAQTRKQIAATTALNVTLMSASQDPQEARALGRRALAFYVGLDYYHRAWRKLGFNNDDFADGGSDRLIDSLVAWGDSSESHRVWTNMRRGCHRDSCYSLESRRRSRTTCATS